MAKRGHKPKRRKVGHHVIHADEFHPIFRQNLTFSQKAADAIAKFGGSWTFIIFFFMILVIWMGFNTFLLLSNAFDPYPYILLNLVLSCLAAIQAPVILMAQNRDAERDRVEAHYDYAVNRRAEREILAIQDELRVIKKLMKNK